MTDAGLVVGTLVEGLRLAGEMFWETWRASSSSACSH